MSGSELSPTLETLVTRAAHAAPLLAARAPSERARALVAIADALEAHAAPLIEIAQRETGLTVLRLTGELRRTAVQLRLFADTVVEGEYLDIRIDRPDANFALGARPDLRRVLIPVGPIINFSASNFPFAFSVMGGDSAAALAAGCPLIVKAHSGHPELSDVTAAVAQQALEECGMPDGTFQMIHGREAGVEILQDPRIKAGSFTGSIAVGSHLARIAANRPTPIPFFGELGSVNPMFITTDAIAERTEILAAELLTSISGSAGQLCTKPGIIFIPENSVLPEAVRRASGFDAQSTDVTVPAATEHRMLGQRIARSYDERHREILAAEEVQPVILGGVRFDDEQHGWATTTIVRVPLAAFRAQHNVLGEEAFGPLSMLVEVPAGIDFAALVPEFFKGNLSGTIHLGAAELSGTTENAAAVRSLVSALSQQVGRVLFNGWPTGVAVTPAQQHGGPWPATTNDSSTSVGNAAVSRFLRPVTFQDAPDAFLPAPLQESNPLSVPRAIAPAGASLGWGSKVPRTIANNAA